MGSLALEEGNLLHGYTWVIGSPKQPSAHYSKMTVTNGHTHTEPFTLEHQIHLLLTDFGRRQRKPHGWDGFDYVLELVSPGSASLEETGIAGCYEGRWAQFEKRSLKFNTDRDAFLAAYYSASPCGAGDVKIYLHDH